MQPSLVLTQSLSLFTVYPMFFIRTFPYNFSPGGVPTASGSLVSISSYTEAFSIFGTTYGGNGLSTFALPNLQGITIIGKGQGNGLSSYTVGQQIGSSTITLTSNQMSAHSHTIPSSTDLTGISGASQPFDNIQPSLSMNYIICINGVYPSFDSDLEAIPFLGQIIPYVANSVPDDWHLADGTTLSISQYIELFSLLGTTYGGDGITTFMLPDLRGRVSIGVASGSNTQLGQQGGTESVTLLTTNLPSHAHSLVGSRYSATQTDPNGSGQSIDNRQPFLGITYIIALQGIYPSRDSGSLDAEEIYIGEIFAFAGNFAPKGCSMVNGAILSIEQNLALFSLLGTNYGGNGFSTFALPDLRDRIILGSGNGFIVGEQVGTSQVTLTTNQIPYHVHTLL